MSSSRKLAETAAPPVVSCLVTVTLAVLVAGCSGSPSTTQDEGAAAASERQSAIAGATSTAREDGAAVASYPPSGAGGDSALLAGTADILDGCLVVVPADATGDQQPYVPIFATSDERTQLLADGDSVELGGGEGSSTPDPSWNYPSACPDGGPFWIVAQPD